MFSMRSLPSILFTATIVGIDILRTIDARSWSNDSGEGYSMRKSMTDERSRCRFALSIICSDSSDERERSSPGVSQMVKLTPLCTTAWAMMSLVSPGNESTMDFFSLMNELNNVDLPTFWRPTIDTTGSFALIMFSRIGDIHVLCHVNCCNSKKIYCGVKSRH